MARRAWRIGVLCILLLGITVSPVSAQTDGDGLAPLPTQATCVPWPTQGWPTAPVSPGVDPAAVDALGAQMVGPGAGDSVVVVHAGRLVYERYADGLGPENFLPSFSISKSFVATLVGMLVDDGVLALDQRAPIDEWGDPDDPRHEITIRHLLHMSSGLLWNEVYGDESADPFQLQQAGDHVAFVTERPLEAVPGTSFRYSTGDTAVLAGAIARVLGVSGPSYDALIRSRIFDPMGMDPALPGFDDLGVWRGGSTTITTTRNYAKLGLLYLRGGVWDGQQLLSRQWVDFVRTPGLVPTYGAHFWLRGDDRFAMIGLLGQGVEIVPRLDLVVAVNNNPQRDAHIDAMVSLFQNAQAPECPEGVAPAADSPPPVATLPATGARAGTLVVFAGLSIALGGLAVLASFIAHVAVPIHRSGRRTG